MILMTTINWVETIFYIIGGFGLFLYGISLTGESLKLLAGNKLKRVIEKTTNTPLKGIFMGVLITVILQTSSGTTALTISLVRSGLMTLPQAVGIILGANIGTTVTSFLIGLNISAISLPMIGIGSMLAFFFKINRYKRLGGALLGFGLIFFGLDLMGETLKQFLEFDVFSNVFISVSDYPVLGVLIGTLFTFLLQSSTGVIGILQSLYTTGALPLIAAIAIVLGSNIGTTITAFIASIGASVSAKRAALIHIIFNVFGSMLFLLLIFPYTIFIQWMQDVFLGGTPEAMTISFAHIFFNIINTFVMYFFITHLVKFSKRMIPGEDTDDLVNVDSLQESLVHDSPPLALEASKKVILSMGDIVRTMFQKSVQYSFNNDRKLLESGRSLEEIVDTLDQKTHDYLVMISQDGLDQSLAHIHSSYVDTIRDFERIADHAQNLFDFFEYRYENKLSLSEEALADLKTLYATTTDIINTMFEAFKDSNKSKAKMVLALEDEIDEHVKAMRRRFVKRTHVAKGETDEELFVDILSNIERIGDHCENIVLNILQEKYFTEYKTVAN